MKRFWTALYVAAVMAGCAGMEVRVDYDPEGMEQPRESYAVVADEGTDRGTLEEQRIQKAIARHLDAKGYRHVAAVDADFRVRYRREIRHDVSGGFTLGLGMGSFSGNVGGSVGTSVTPTHDEEFWTLEILMVPDDRVVWRATAGGRAPEGNTPGAKEAGVRRFVDALLEEFPRSGEPFGSGSKN